MASIIKAIIAAIRPTRHYEYVGYGIMVVGTESWQWKQEAGDDY